MIIQLTYNIERIEHPSFSVPLEPDFVLYFEPDVQHRAYSILRNSYMMRSRVNLDRQSPDNTIKDYASKKGVDHDISRRQRGPSRIPFTVVGNFQLGRFVDCRINVRLSYSTGCIIMNQAL